MYVKKCILHTEQLSLLHTSTVIPVVIEEVWSAFLWLSSFAPKVGSKNYREFLRNGSFKNILFVINM